MAILIINFLDIKLNLTFNQNNPGQIEFSVYAKNVFDLYLYLLCSAQFYSIKQCQLDIIWSSQYRFSTNMFSRVYAYVLVYVCFCPRAITYVQRKHKAGVEFCSIQLCCGTHSQVQKITYALSAWHNAELYQSQPN